MNNYDSYMSAKLVKLLKRFKFNHLYKQMKIHNFGLLVALILLALIQKLIQSVELS